RPRVLRRLSCRAGGAEDGEILAEAVLVLDLRLRAGVEAGLRIEVLAEIVVLGPSSARLHEARQTESERDAACEEGARITPSKARELSGEAFDVVLAQPTGELPHHRREAASVAGYRAVAIRLELVGRRLDGLRDRLGAVGDTVLGAFHLLAPSIERRSPELVHLALRALELLLGGRLAFERCVGHHARSLH